VPALYRFVGPKLYEANWQDLVKDGYIANVSCAEVRCKMTALFYREYLRSKHQHRRLLIAMNPNKLRTAEFLMRSVTKACVASVFPFGVVTFNPPRI
jgi:superfamily II DNA or RNA helicase